MARARRGFTLIEILISIGVVGVIVLMYAAILNTFPLTRDAQHEDIALRIAETEMQRLRAGGYDNLPASGSFSDTQMSSLPSGSGTVAVTDQNSKTKQVVVAVVWQDAGYSARSVSLATLITQVGGL